MSEEQLEYSAKLLANKISLEKEIERLNNLLQQKENIIKEVREYLINTPKIIKSMYFVRKSKEDEEQAIAIFLEPTIKHNLLEILDKAGGIK